jgi:hypothetical protein
MNRRNFLKSAVFSAVAARAYASAEPARRPRILLRSSWQVVNIGDIAHTPGVLALLEEHFPTAEVRLWASGDLTPDVAEMEHKRFPNLKIVKGSIGSDGKGSTPELHETLEWTDFFLHGSGPSLVAAKDLAAFDQHYKKPFGVFGITYGGGTDAQQELMSRAQFLYFRDSVSLGKAKEDGIRCPVMEFGPDGAFACDLKDDASADRFLRESKLDPGEFLCCIPRLRFTPYWLIKAGRAKDEAKHARSEEMKEHDHAPLRDAISAVVRETNKKVLLCPEDMTQMQVGKELIYDQLPADVRSGVVWREKFWLTDEALSTYRKSAGFFGLEMHSPIMCIGNGIPALVGRFAEQTSKGFMWKDIGLGDWLFDFDQPQDLEKLTPTVLSLVREPDKAREKAAQAQALVDNRQREMVQQLIRCVPAV